jgi:phosphatidylglycerophosphate synthase
MHALVFDTDAPFRPEGAAPSPVSPEARIAGLTLLQRAVFLAWRAGAQRISVFIHDPEVASRWKSRRQPPVPVTVLTPDGLLSFESDRPVLVLAAQVLPRAALLERLVEEYESAGGAVAATLTSEACGGPLIVPPGYLDETGEASQPPSAGTPECLNARTPLEAQVRQAQRAASLLMARPGDYRRIDSQQALRDADRSLYVGLTSVTDGWVDRVFNRHISGWFTRRIINLPITPNGVTWFHFSLGLLAAALFWQGEYWQHALGAVLFQLSVALDCSDGEVARLKFQFSPFGSRLDVITDNIVTVAVFAAIAKAAAVHLGLPTALLLGALMVTGVLMSVLIVFSLAKMLERRRPGEVSSLAVTNRLSSNDQGLAAQSTLVDKVINEATSRDFSVLVVAFALINHLEWFAWLAGIGSHVFWIVFGLVQLSMLRAPNAQTR